MQVSGQIYGVDDQTNFETYAEAVEEYSSRDISFHEDTVKAFAGILSVLRTSFRGDFLFGLPDTELDQALLWQPKRALSRRKDGNGNELFPSWSWAGWEGGVRYWPNLALSRVQWKDAVTGRYFTSCRFRRPETAESGDAWFQDDWVRENPSLEREEWWTYDLCYHEKENPDMLFLHPVSKDTNSAGLESFTHVRPDTYHLSIRCMAIRFIVTGEHGDPLLSTLVACKDDQHIVCALKVFNRIGSLVGTVHIPGSIAKDFHPGEYDFICLSRTHLVCDTIRATDMSPFGDGFDDSGQGTDTQDPPTDMDSETSILGPEDSVEFDVKAFYASKPWCIYNVLLVETVNGGDSRRVGLGKVHVDAFLGGEWAWKDMILG